MEKIEVYKLMDGKTFEDHDKALAYCSDKVGEELDDIIKRIPNIGLRERIKIVEVFLISPKLVKLISNWVNEHNDLEKG